MSDPAGALAGARFEGLVTVSECGPRGMITLRGDLDSKPIADAVKGATGVAVPAARTIALNGAKGVAWMSPDELLIMVPHEEATAAATLMEKALSGQHTLVADVSDARAVFAIEGADARDTLAKLAPVDLHPQSFAPGDFRRTHLAQVPAAFWMTDKTRFEVVCFRSVAAYVFDLISAAAAEGSEVGLFSA